MQSLVVENRLGRENCIQSALGLSLAGVIIDSWVEPPQRAGPHVRLVLQIAPEGHPDELVIIEADATLVPDPFWLEDLRENLCNGSPVLAIGSWSSDGLFEATWLHLAR
jgi:hypothetical protein